MAELFIYDTLDMKHYIVHKLDCPFAGGIKSGRRFSYEHDWRKKSRNSRFFIPCRFCLKLHHRYWAEKHQIDDFCKKNKLNFCLADNRIYVDDESDKWIIAYSENKNCLALYHKNKITGRDTSFISDFEYISGYHRQTEADCPNLISAFRAICNHRMSNPAKTISQRAKFYISMAENYGENKYPKSKKNAGKLHRRKKRYMNRGKAWEVQGIIDELMRKNK